MAITVRDRYTARLFQNEKATGQGALIPGVPRFVVPGASASAFALVQSVHQFVYTDIVAAYADCVAGQGDAVVCMPGAHTLSANLAWNKANVSLWGWEAWAGLTVLKPSAIITGAAGVAGITITAADAAIVGISLVPITAQIGISFSAAANRMRIANCHIDMVTPAVNIATKGIVASGAASDVHISTTRFVSGGAQGPGMDLTAVIESLVENCQIYNNLGSWAVGVQLGAGCKGLVFRRNYFSSYGTALTVGIDFTGADQTSGVELDDNRASTLVTTPFKNAAAVGRAILNENFVGTVGGGSGGTLIASIT